MMQVDSCFNKHMDLRGVSCPVNFIRCRLAAENLDSQEHLEVYLDRGEPESMVIPGLKEQGFYVKVIHEDSNWIKLMVALSAR